MIGQLNKSQKCWYW